MNTITTIPGNHDMRGMAWAVTTANDAVLTSGTIPVMMSPEHELSTADCYLAIAERSQGVLHVAPIACQAADDASGQPREPLICGMTWAEIQARQQGGSASRPVDPRVPADAVPVRRAA